MKQWLYYHHLMILLLHPYNTSSFTTNINHKISSKTKTNSIPFLSYQNILENEEFYKEKFNFRLDTWQIQSGNEIHKNKNVIVCAPTGSGKTVIGEIALHLAFETNNKAIYTTPLKALSNQKYIELRTIFGKNNVGLSTGDMSINRDAGIMVMTTEVYRNMCWRRASKYSQEDFQELDDVSYVIFDEFHYMGQPGRGSVWEESVIMSPPHTKLICLSATLPNASDLSQWIESVTNRNTVLIEATHSRPVPLLYNYAFRGSGDRGSGGIVPLFRNENAGPGSPLGLLGLRGDGIPEEETKKKKKETLPKGLHINPIILTSLRKSTEKINRILARKLQEQEEQQPYSSPSTRKKNSSYNAQYEKKERNRLLKLEMKKNVPSLSSIVTQLSKKKLLPAIVFIFSRAGCEDAVKKVCEDMFAVKTTSSVEGNTKSIKKEQRYDIEDDVEPLKKKSGGRSRAYKKAKALQQQQKDKQLLQDVDGRIFRDNFDNIDYLFESKRDKVNEDYIDILQDDLQSILVSDANMYDKLQLYAKYGLCSMQEVMESCKRIQNFNEANLEIAIPKEIMKYMLLGVAAHHAGILPAHKLLIETLYKEQLIKIVFATETLAAGINMPARTTVITSIAKFTTTINNASPNNNDNGYYGSSYTSNTHSLLPTSNFLQMAGRAGRRGMDTQGTCVILASAFEGPQDAASILLKEVEPICSQFTPSYSLVLNLIARGGNGKLDFAKELIGKSFALWQKKKGDDSSDLSLNAMDGMEDDPLLNFMNENNDIIDLDLEAIANERFVLNLINLIQQASIDEKEEILATFGDKATLKQELKSFTALNKILQLEMNTLSYLERELEEMKSVQIEVDEFLSSSIPNDDTKDDDEEQSWVEDDIIIQQRRVQKSQEDLNHHIFTKTSSSINTLLQNTHDKTFVQSLLLARSLQNDENKEILISPGEIATFCKTLNVLSKKQRKKYSKLLQIDDGEEQEDDVDSTWSDTLSLVNTLEAYGCLQKLDSDIIDINNTKYEITSAGSDVALLGFENSLWSLVAMGGTYDVNYESKELDLIRTSFDGIFDDEDEYYNDYVVNGNQDNYHGNHDMINPHIEEAELHLSNILSLTPPELAGYVSILVAEENRRSNDNLIFHMDKLTKSQQRAIQTYMLSAERFMEVQRKFNVHESFFSVVDKMELSFVQTVTAWASGKYDWNEVVEISGMSAGDLVRILHRSLDALRQFSNLPYHAVRRDGTEGGIHPEIRRMCKEAASVMNRYPLKDPLPFDEEDEYDDYDDDLNGENDLVVESATNEVDDTILENK